eukprot:6570445-Prymnesium_polylepis.1
MHHVEAVNPNGELPWVLAKAQKGLDKDVACGEGTDQVPAHGLPSVREAAVLTIDEDGNPCNDFHFRGVERCMCHWSARRHREGSEYQQAAENLQWARLGNGWQRVVRLVTRVGMRCARTLFARLEENGDGRWTDACDSRENNADFILKLQ